VAPPIKTLEAGDHQAYSSQAVPAQRACHVNPPPPSNENPWTLQVHWLRIILDEGHTLGSPNITNKLSMACEVRPGRALNDLGNLGPLDDLSGCWDMP
jgi:hypothetical protein